MVLDGRGAVQLALRTNPSSGQAAVPSTQARARVAALQVAIPAALVNAPWGQIVQRRLVTLPVAELLRRRQLHAVVTCLVEGPITAMEVPMKMDLILASR